MHLHAVFAGCLILPAMRVVQKSASNADRAAHGQTRFQAMQAGLSAAGACKVSSFHRAPVHRDCACPAGVAAEARPFAIDNSRSVQLQPRVIASQSGTSLLHFLNVDTWFTLSNYKNTRCLVGAFDDVACVTLISSEFLFFNKFIQRYESLIHTVSAANSRFYR
ncbi:hypothetical protein [Xanthomonas hortorum]|nr:hypothetical protein [Xanthomonas hortorum pv. hederae]